MSADDTTGSGRQSKVARVIDEYELDDFGAELERRWTGETGERESLRTLADALNREILRAAMEKADMDPLDGEVSNTYRLLTDDDVSTGVRTQTRRRLERNGVDVDSLESNFVSHQSIHTYLRDHRGARIPEETTKATPESELETIQRLQSRVSAVTEDSLDRLTRSDELDMGEFEVFVDISVFCEDCGTQYDVSELVDRGGCDCEI